MPLNKETKPYSDSFNKTKSIQIVYTMAEIYVSSWN